MISRIVFIIISLFIVLPGCTTSHTLQPSSFIDLGNGIFQVPGSNLMWQKESSRLLNSKEKALEYVQNLNLGGYTDWRLPTPDEVLDLHNAIDFGISKEGDQGIYLRGNYWCALSADEIIAGSWQDGDSCEITRSYFTKIKGHVRAVRP